MTSNVTRAGANQLDDFVCCGQTASLLLGIDSLTIQENFQRPRWAQAEASGNSQFVFDALFQAHGLRFDITSKEAPLDFDGHDGLCRY
jgi:hypothetical protein